MLDPKFYHILDLHVEQRTEIAWKIFFTVAGQLFNLPDGHAASAASLQSGTGLLCSVQCIVGSVVNQKIRLSSHRAQQGCVVHEWASSQSRLFLVKEKNQFLSKSRIFRQGESLFWETHHAVIPIGGKTRITALRKERRTFRRRVLVQTGSRDRAGSYM